MRKLVDADAYKKVDVDARPAWLITEWESSDKRDAIEAWAERALTADEKRKREEAALFGDLSTTLGDE